LIQSELDKLRTSLNNHVTRCDHKKLLPSGVAPNISYSLPEKYNGEDCLQPINRDTVAQVMEQLGGEDLIRFVSTEYATRAALVLSGLGMAIKDISFNNVWTVFEAMLPHM
jgi:hypothetical protein